MADLLGQNKDRMKTGLRLKWANFPSKLSCETNVFSDGVFVPSSTISYHLVSSSRSRLHSSESTRVRRGIRRCFAGNQAGMRFGREVVGR